MSTTMTNMRCKQCGERLIRVICYGRDMITPRRMSYCKGYKVNAYHPDTKICKSTKMIAEQ